MVRRLLTEQFPQWTNLSIALVSSTGTVNAMYRLGEDMVVRLPRVDWAIDGMDREFAWLPWLASRLPVAVQELDSAGHSAEGVPWRWCAYRCNSTAHVLHLFPWIAIPHGRTACGSIERWKRAARHGNS